MRIAGELGLIDPVAAKAAGDAYREYRRLQHARRLSSTPKAPVLRDEVEHHVVAVNRLWSEVFGAS